MRTAIGAHEALSGPLLLVQCREACNHQSESGGGALEEHACQIRCRGRQKRASTGLTPQPVCLQRLCYAAMDPDPDLPAHSFLPPSPPAPPAWPPRPAAPAPAACPPPSEHPARSLPPVSARAWPRAPPEGQGEQQQGAMISFKIAVASQSKGSALLRIPLILNRVNRYAVPYAPVQGKVHWLLGQAQRLPSRGSYLGRAQALAQAHCLAFQARCPGHQAGDGQRRGGH